MHASKYIHMYVFILVHTHTHERASTHRDEIDVVCVCMYTKIFSTHLILVPILHAAIAARVGPHFAQVGTGRRRHRHAQAGNNTHDSH